MSLKMRINNEEVLCDKEFTIKEEMLNTSSTILNNCFPKEWEEDKDYTSKFYYPQDYSKCVINEEEEPVEVIGNNAVINAGKDYEFKNLTIEGNLEQQTYSGKNLLDEDKYKNSEYTIDVYKATQTNINGNKRLFGKAILKSGKSAMSGVYVGISATINPNNTTQKMMVISNGITSDKEYTYTVGSNLYFSVYPSTTNIQTLFDTYNFIVSETNVPYEPYVGGIPSPNPDYPQEIDVVDGVRNLLKTSLQETTINNITIKKNTDGTYELNGIASANTSIDIFSDKTIPSGRYKVVCCPSGGSSTTYYVATRFDGTWGERDTGNGAIINFTNFGKLSLWIAKDQVLSNFIIKPMITSDITLTYNEYLPYGSNYLINKITGKNLFEPFKNNIVTGTTTFSTKIATIKQVYNYQKQLILQDGIMKGYPAQNTGSYYIYSIKFDNLKPNKRYLLSFKYDIKLNTTEDKQFILGNTILRIRTDSTGIATKTFTTNENGSLDYFQLTNIATSVNNECYFELYDFLLEEMDSGSTPTEYESYKETIVNYDLKNNFLAKIGNYIGTLEEVSGKLNKNIGKVVLDGSESGWGYNSNTKTFYITGINAIPHSVCYSTHFKYNGDNTTINNSCYYGTAALCFIYNEKTNLNDFKTLLSQNPVTVYYILNEEQEIQLTPIQTLLFEGINNFSVLDNVSKIKYQLQKILFSGVVENTGDISLRPEDPKYCSLQILDYKCFLSEGETLDFVISGKTIEEAIEMVVNASADYGVVLGNINILNGNDMIGAYSTLDKTPYDVLQYLADISQSRWTTRRINDKQIAIDFYDPTLMPKGESIEYTKEWFCKNQIMNLSFNYSSRDYRNKQVMTSNKVYADITYTEIVRADGYNNTFTTNEQIGRVVGITINGVEQTVTTNTNKELGESADFYYSEESNTITSDDILQSGTEIRVVYIPLLQGRQVIRNTNEINRVSNNLQRKGVVSRYENRNDATSSDELQKIGQSYIKYKGIPEINVNVQTQNNIWKVGDVVYFNSPIEELQQEYMVKTKESRYITSVDKIFYTYILTSSFNSETEINYFDNQRNKSAGNLKEGTFINRNMDIESEANIIFDNLVIEEVQ